MFLCKAGWWHLWVESKDQLKVSDTRCVQQEYQAKRFEQHNGFLPLFVNNKALFCSENVLSFCSIKPMKSCFWVKSVTLTFVCSLSIPHKTSKVKREKKLQVDKALTRENEFVLAQNNDIKENWHKPCYDNTLAVIMWHAQLSVRLILGPCYAARVYWM